jgi:hypothetical protein
MNISKTIACSLSMLAIGVLAACGSGMAQAPGIASAAARPDLKRAWMSPGARSRDLLYVSDIYTEDVYVFSWPKGKLEGTLTGFGEPEGECVDKADNLWIVDTTARDVLEYAHGGTNPIATLQDAYGYPVGCAIDKKTGNLAVTDVFNEVSSGQTRGGVLIYPRASGSPTQYQDPEIWFYDFCGYDNHGNLYVDGINSISSDDFAFAELPKGASGFSNIALNQHIDYPGGIQSIGGTVDVLDELSTPPTIYAFSISGSKGTLQASTPLGGGYSGWVNEFAISKSRVIAPVYDDSQPPSGNSEVNIYAYPAGGNPIKSLTANSRVFGAAISKAK